MVRRVVVSAGVLVAAVTVAAEPLPVAPPPHPAPGPMLNPGRSFALKAQVDLFVAATKAWELPADDDRLWQPVLDLADDLARRSKFPWWPPEGARWVFGPLTEFRRLYHPRWIRSTEAYEQPKSIPVKDPLPRSFFPGGIMAPGVSSLGGLRCNFVVSRGDVRTVKTLGDSIVYANGNVAVGDLLVYAIVVCDGDVTVAGDVDNSLVVARGSIHAKGLTSGSTLVAGGEVKLANRVKAPKFLVPVVREKEPNAFGFVTFFELSAVGVEVEAADGIVTVAAVADKKPFAAAGVRAGDVVTGVNGKTPDSAESLRRLLRDALALGGAAVALRRGGADVTATISLPE